MVTRSRSRSLSHSVSLSLSFGVSLTRTNSLIHSFLFEPKLFHLISSIRKAVKEADCSFRRNFCSKGGISHLFQALDINRRLLPDASSTAMLSYIQKGVS